MAMSMDGVEWKEEYGIVGILKSGDIAKTSELMLADAKVQVAEEPQAPAFTVFGQCEKVNTRENPPTPDDKKELLFWYARFASKEAYMTDHRNRESNKTFAKKFMATFESFPKDDPTNVDKIMAAGAKDMAGSYMGPLYHLEKTGAGAIENPYTTVVCAKTKSPEDAGKLVEALKEHGLKQLTGEPGALRYTVVPPSATGIPGKGSDDFPGAKDDLTVMWLEAWKSLDDYDNFHKDQPYTIREKIMGCVAFPHFWLTEFAGAKHFAK